MTNSLRRRKFDELELGKIEAEPQGMKKMKLSSEGTIFQERSQANDPQSSLSSKTIEDFEDIFFDSFFRHNFSQQIAMIQKDPSTSLFPELSEELNLLRICQLNEHMNKNIMKVRIFVLIKFILSRFLLFIRSRIM